MTTPPASAAARHELEDRARTSGRLLDWRAFAYALLDESEVRRALTVLRDASRIAPQDESGADHDDERAACLLVMWRICNDHGLLVYGEWILRSALQIVSDGNLRASAGQQLAALRELRDRQRRDGELQCLQYAYLKERLRAGEGESRHHVSLASLHLQVGKPDQSGSRLAGAAQLLKEGRVGHPNDVSIIEAQARLAAASGDGATVDEVLADLERVAPGSELLAEFWNGRGVADPGSINPVRGQLAWFLSEVAASHDAVEAEHAVTQLEELVREVPRALPLRLILAYGLLNFGARERALDEARTLSRSARQCHEDHWNVAGLFLACADRESALTHAALSLRYAKDEADRRDATSLLEQCEAVG